MPLNLILDAVIVVIMIFGIVMGITRGFVQTVAKPIRIVASLGVAFGLCKPVGEEFIQPYFQAPLSEKIRAFLEEKCAEITAENASSELPGILKLVAKIFGVDINEVAGDATNSIIDSIVDALAEPIAHFGATVCAFLGLLIVTGIVCFLLFKLIDLVLNIGPLEIINKSLGCIVGAAFAFLMAWALTIGFDYVTTLPMFADNEMIQNFDGGVIYRFVKQINPIDLLFKL